MSSPQLPAIIDQLNGAPPPPGRWTEFGRPLQVAFLEALAECGNVRAAATSVGVSYRTAYRARRGDPAFRQAWTGALIASRPVSEDVLTTRAIDGVEEVVWFRGEEVGRRVRYDSRLLLAHLGRLDKLCEDAVANAIAEDFEGALARFAAGEEPAPPPAESSAPGHRDKCDKSNSAAPAVPPAPAAPAASSLAEEPCEWTDPDEDCPECGGPCTGPGGDCREYEARIGEMYDARPAGAPWPNDYPGLDPDAGAAAQLRAYELGVAQWWVVLPRD